MQRLLIVDDHDAFRSWARMALGADGFEVVAEAADGASAIAEARRVRPDVALIDVQLPDIDGFDVARQLIQDPGTAAIVMVSSRDAVAYVGDIESVGVPFVSKVDLTGDAVRAALGGRR